VLFVDTSDFRLYNNGFILRRADSIQWGTVREDYSASGDAWNYFSHDQARSRAYRWGEDGLAGISDEQQFLCFAIALWNRKDPIRSSRVDAPPPCAICGGPRRLLVIRRTCPRSGSRAGCCLPRHGQVR
jgi:hypothetical protein